jgi:uncharacterized protein YjiS (DUF1127 family)
MSAFERVQMLKQKFRFRLWFDRLDLRADAMNISDRALCDMGLSRRDVSRPIGTFWLN